MLLSVPVTGFDKVEKHNIIGLSKRGPIGATLEEGPVAPVSSLNIHLETKTMSGIPIFQKKKKKVFSYLKMANVIKFKFKEKNSWTAYFNAKFLPGTNFCGCILIP